MIRACRVPLPIPADATNPTREPTLLHDHPCFDEQSNQGTVSHCRILSFTDLPALLSRRSQVRLLLGRPDHGDFNCVDCGDYGLDWLPLRSVAVGRRYRVESVILQVSNGICRKTQQINYSLGRMFFVKALTHL